ncbi:MAG: hypothetical protein WC379_13665 [Methanoregula sp.]
MSGAVRWVYAALIGTFDRLESGLSNLQSDLYTPRISPLITQSRSSQNAIDLERNAHNEIEESINRQIAQIELYKQNQTPAQKKLSNDLLQLIDDKYPIKTQSRDQIKQRMYTRKQLIPKSDGGTKQKLSPEITQGVDDQVNVEIYLEQSSPTNITNSLVTQVTGRDEKNHFVEAWVGINNLERLASSPGVKAISTAEGQGHSAGSVMTQGDSILHADGVRSTYSVDGSSVKIGVISDGVDHIADAQSPSKLDLPSNVHVLNNNYGGDEGTATLEVIHDVAPGAELYFYGSDNTATKMNQAIDGLVAANVDIIGSSLFQVGKINDEFICHCIA